MQRKARVGIDEVVAHSDRSDGVASRDPELRMWDALDAGTHDDTLQGAILEHMQALKPPTSLLLRPARHLAVMTPAPGMML